MRIFPRTGQVIIAAVIGTVALVSRLIDATIARVGRLSDRLDATFAELAQESNARHERPRRHRIGPIGLR
ncbi:hypothetical protein [Methylobacterium sp. NEAU K]|uniref:hypothetical protein n=1 Tax=Methylobacterium sp. NEAU K TaxID=3064946 RepID=UPI002733F911|nr:hypothetical protein [Methylobacterium sp. NEAU K]MDP4002361.1 hypothetical protein [Methylobacterium sp. NEAU K]